MVIRLALSILLLCLGWASGDFARAGMLAAQQENRDGIVQDEFFSGLVQDFTETSVSVSRVLPGKSPETRVFVVDSETIVEGKLKKLARVTVGYRSQDGQDHAWRIIVRDAPE